MPDRPRNAWVDTDAELSAAAKRAAAAGITPRSVTGTVTEEDWVQAAATARAERNLVSASESYKIGDPVVGRLIRPDNGTEWQQEVWQFYDAVGELHYVATQNGRAVARVRFYVAEYDKDNVMREVEKGEPARVSRDLLGGEAQAPDITFTVGVQGIISGQSLLTVHNDDGWAVYSDQDFSLNQADLMRARAKNGISPYRINTGQGAQQLKNGTLTIHMWDRHPGFARRVDSSTRPALPYLRELCRLDEYVQATLLSRIATAGILEVPQKATIPPPPNLPEEVKDGVHALSHWLSKLAQINVSNPGTAAALVPLVVDMPEDSEIRHVQLDYPLTEVVNQFRELNLKRIAMSMDMAPEVMSGFSGVKYSNAEFIANENVRTHIMRRVQSIAAALTRHYVRPLLGEQFSVQADLSDLEVQPDRSENAIAVYDRGEIDGDTLREETGLRDGQPPEEEELLRQLAYRAATTNPSLLPYVLPLLGVKSTITLPTQPGTQQIEADPQRDSNSTEPQPADAVYPRTVPSADDDRPQGPRGPQPIVSSELVAACDVLVAGALARIGAQWRKRKRSRVNASKDCDPTAVYLAPCFNLDADLTEHESRREHVAAMVGGMGGAPRVAVLHGADPECLTASLTDYVASLVCERRPHTPDAIADALTACVGV